MMDHRTPRFAVSCMLSANGFPRGSRALIKSSDFERPRSRSRTD